MAGFFGSTVHAERGLPNPRLRLRNFCDAIPTHGSSWLQPMSIVLANSLSPTFVTCLARCPDFLLPQLLGNAPRFDCAASCV